MSFSVMGNEPGSKRIKASLFVTCLVDLFFPQVGESVVRVLRRLGVDVNFPNEQTCCGQPAFNSGYTDDARALAERFVGVFSGDSRDTYIVSPSGSCASMVKVFYEELFKNDPALCDALSKVSSRVYEFSSFLTDVLGVEDVGASYDGVVTYHDSCHLLRELGISEAPRRLIKSVSGVKFIEAEMHDECCGFGGTFSVKHPEVSVSMLDEKLTHIGKSGADTLVSTDMGCLMQIGGAVSRRELPIRVMHLAELLAS